MVILQWMGAMTSWQDLIERQWNACPLQLFARLCKRVHRDALCGLKLLRRLTNAALLLTYALP